MINKTFSIAVASIAIAFGIAWELALLPLAFVPFVALACTLQLYYLTGLVSCFMSCFIVSMHKSCRTVYNFSSLIDRISISFYYLQ